MSNTYPQTRGCGEDWLSVGLNVAWDRGKLSWQSVSKRLQMGRRAAESFGAPERLEVYGLDVEIQAGGVRPGGRRGQYFGVRLRYRNVFFAFVESGEYAGTGYNVWCEVSSLECVAVGGMEGLREIYREVIAAWSGEIERERMRRVDLRVDLTGIRVSDFIAAFDCGDVVTRFKRDQYARWGAPGAETSLYLGKSPLQLRIYNKSEEMRVKGQAGLLEYMQRCVWKSGEETVTRVEFECLRSWLRERCGIDSVDDYLAGRRDLVERLAVAQVRFVTSDGRVQAWDRPMSTAWVEVHGALVRFAGEPGRESGQRARLGAAGVDGTRYWRQALPMMMSAAVYETGDEIANIVQFFEYVADSMNAHCSGGEFERWLDEARKRVFGGKLEIVKGGN